jgi:hydrogenase maturation protease
MLCVIGCGNSTRSDDGVGVAVAQTLLQGVRQNPHPHVRVFDAGTGGMDVMFQVRGARKLILIDAARSGAEPGAIFKVPGEELAAAPDAGFSLHDFRWQHALTAARKIFAAEFPQDVTVFLVEAQSLAFGLELTPAVAQAATRVVQEIRAIMLGYRLAPAAADAPAQIAVARGNLYLSREICDAYFPDVMSVALLARDGEILIVPLTRESGGGLLLKQRNVRGDRVIHAQEFFRKHGLPEQFEARTASAAWSADAAALVLGGLGVDR